MVNAVRFYCDGRSATVILGEYLGIICFFEGGRLGKREVLADSWVRFWSGATSGEQMFCVPPRA